MRWRRPRCRPHKDPRHTHRIDAAMPRGRDSMRIDPASALRTSAGYEPIYRDGSVLRALALLLLRTAARRFISAERSFAVMLAQRELAACEVRAFFAFALLPSQALRPMRLK